jgi:iron complex transport system substrate-binding protein
MQRVKDRKPPRTVMITGRLGNGLLLVARPGTYTGDAIELAGGRFALEGRGAIAQVSPEAILVADPDVLLYAGSPADRDALIERPGWSEMRAVTMKRVYTANRVELLIPGPRTIDGIEHLAALLHPTFSQQ